MENLSLVRATFEGKVSLNRYIFDENIKGGLKRPLPFHS
jgi:hypothetical protein